MAAKVAVKPLESEVPGSFITDTAEHTGDFFAIASVAAAVATLVSSRDGTYTSIPIPAGMTLYGRWQNITLASGKVVAYSNR